MVSKYNFLTNGLGKNNLTFSDLLTILENTLLYLKMNNDIIIISSIIINDNEYHGEWEGINEYFIGVLQACV